MSAATLSGNAGPKYFVEADGKRYPVAFMDQRILDEYAMALYQSEQLALKRSIANTDDERRAESIALRKAWVAGDFEFESERGQAYLQTRSGTLLLAQLMLGLDKLTTVRLAKVVGDPFYTAITDAMRESFPEIEFTATPDSATSGAPDPNQKSAGA